MALSIARIGGKIDNIFPGLLQEAVEKGWRGFQDELTDAYKNRLCPSFKSLWEIYVLNGWDSVSHSLALKGCWPFCFWSDETTVEFLSLMDVEGMTLDKWRKWRREMGLLRPHYTVNAGVVPVYDGTQEDEMDRKLEGFRLQKRVRRLPTKAD